jgi:hypothetical protein
LQGECAIVRTSPFPQTTPRQQGTSALAQAHFLNFPEVSANSNGVVSDQISKLFVSHVEESMAEYMGVNGVYEKLGKGNTKGSMVNSGGRWKQREHASVLQVL